MQQHCNIFDYDVRTAKHLLPMLVRCHWGAQVTDLKSVMAQGPAWEL